MVPFRLDQLIIFSERCCWTVIGFCHFHGRCHGDIWDSCRHRGCWLWVDVAVGCC